MENNSSFLDSTLVRNIIFKGINQRIRGQKILKNCFIKSIEEFINPNFFLKNTIECKPKRQYKINISKRGISPDKNSFGYIVSLIRKLKNKKQINEQMKEIIEYIIKT